MSLSLVLRQLEHRTDVTSLLRGSVPLLCMLCELLCLANQPQGSNPSELSAAVAATNASSQWPKLVRAVCSEVCVCVCVSVCVRVRVRVPSVSSAVASILVFGELPEHSACIPVP